jgi:hypothetical protein
LTVRSLTHPWLGTETLALLDDLTALHFTVSGAVHPATYLNKILLGSREGFGELFLSFLNRLPML